MKEINWWIFLSEIECFSYSLAYFKYLAKVKRIESIFKLISEIKSSHNLLMKAQVVFLSRFLPINYLLKGISSDAGVLFLQRLQLLSPEILLCIFQPSFKSI